MSPSKSIAASVAADLEEIHSSWGWFVALGIALIVLGVAGIIYDVTATLATVLAFGWLLIVGAVVSLIQAFRVHNWSGFFLYLLSALLRGFTGYLLIRYPLTGEISLTLVLASFFIVGGAFRAIGAGALQFPQWGWAAVSGVVSVALGVMLLMQLPASSLWFIGFAIGIEFIFDGASFIALGTAVRQVPGTRAFAKT
ncbi:MAG TPA: HdeD family acid-resistance protein [Steroidobacteraceae bacterium]|nr:HdeD family acid-resistance protein [Steroidobacteraceae bacterium]HVP34298.1 HdeD family acid-resistance protein [Steroidobacteraceae bacterium]